MPLCLRIQKTINTSLLWFLGFFFRVISLVPSRSRNAPVATGVPLGPMKKKRRGLGSPLQKAEWLCPLTCPAALLH